MIKLPAYFTGFSSKADGSASLRFATQELTPDDFAELKKVHNDFGWLLFAPNISDEDIPEENAEEEGISASERLRRRMWVYWKNKVNDGDYDSWRRKQLEIIGERYLEKIDERNTLER